MAKNKITQSGFSLVELLVVIALIALALGTWGAFYLSYEERKTCGNQLVLVQDSNLLASQQPGDNILCRNAKSLTERYNETCGDVLGTLEARPCD